MEVQGIRDYSEVEDQWMLDISEDVEGEMLDFNMHKQSDRNPMIMAAIAPPLMGMGRRLFSGILYKIGLWEIGRESILDWTLEGIYCFRLDWTYKRELRGFIYFILSCPTTSRRRKGEKNEGEIRQKWNPTEILRLTLRLDEKHGASAWTLTLTRC